MAIMGAYRECDSPLMLPRKFHRKSQWGRPVQSCKVLITHIDKNVEKSRIVSLLSTFGFVNRSQTTDEDGGYYRIVAQFDTPEQAHQAVRGLRGRMHEGHYLEIDYFNPNFVYSNGAGGHPPHNRRANGAMGGRGGIGGIANGRGGPMSNGGHLNNSMGVMGGPGPGYYPPPMGPPPPRDIPLRMLVPSDMVGAIIGKGGTTIKQITQQSRARVDVHRKDAGGVHNEGQLEKVINIYGSVDHCSAACTKILEVMQAEQEQSLVTNGAASKNYDEPVMLKLLAHNNLVGRVIGRSHAVIKKIMEDTNAKISLSPIYDPRERIIVIKGSLEEMAKAQYQITAKMRQCYEHDIQQAAVMGGYGGPNMPVHGMGPTGMGPPHPPPAFGPSFNRPPLPPPPPHAHHSSGGHIQGNFYPPYGPMGVPAPGGHFYPPGDGNVETVQVWVPACTVGAIIGKGGTSIREMIRVSSCSIKVSPTNARDENKSKEESKDNSENNSDKDDSSDTPNSSTAESNSRRDYSFAVYPHPSDRRVTLTGTAEAQWRAQCLLYRKIFLEAVEHIEQNQETASDPQLQAGHLKVEMNVPSNQVGRIIGKGGQTVKELQRLTHAIIKLPEEFSKGHGANAEPSDETPVYLVGDFYAVQAAQRQIRALVARNSNVNAKKKEESVTKTHKVEGDCNTSESQC